MARKMTEWPSKRGPITKIMPSDGCIGDTVPLAVGKWYEFHEFGWHMGNVGVDHGWPLRKVLTVAIRLLAVQLDLQGPRMVLDPAVTLAQHAPILDFRRAGDDRDGGPDVVLPGIIDLAALENDAERQAFHGLHALVLALR